MFRMRRLSGTAVVATLILVTIGGYTRGSGSGYGCEDRWPLCENGLAGGLLPRLEFHMIVEWTHRWVAALVGLVIIAVAVGAWRGRDKDRLSVWLSVAAVVAVGVQGWIGRLVVTNDLDADLVSVHLAISMTVLGLLTAIWVLASGPPVAVPSTRWRVLTWSGAAGAIAILLLGSYVHNLYVSGWPLVGNRLVPDLSHRLIAVHFAHRVAAPLLLGYFVYLAVASQRTGRAVFHTRLLWSVVGLFSANIALGAAHVFTKVDSSVIVAAHLLVATLVWTAMVVEATATSVSGPDVAVA